MFPQWQTPEEKNAVSHRSRALRRLAEALDRLSAQPPVLLGGFMGVGKSTVGRLLAEKLGYDFIDMDDHAAGLAGESVRSMLEQGREAEFRVLEEKAAAELASRPACVIAAGGGALASETVGPLLRRACFTVLLTRDPESVFPLISADPGRPLAFGKSREELLALLERRLPAYRENARLTVSNDGNPEETAEKIALFYQKACNQPENLL